MAKVYSAADVVGKDLFAKVNINVRSNATTESTKLATIKAGERVGTVYSYVYGKDKNGQRDGTVWWQLDGKFGGKTGYVKHQVGWYDVKALEAQGLQSEEEKQQEKDDADKPWYEKLAEEIKGDIGKVLLIGAGVYVVVKLGTSAIEQHNSNKPKQITT